MKKPLLDRIIWFATRSLMTAAFFYYGSFFLFSVAIEDILGWSETGFQSFEGILTIILLLLFLWVLIEFLFWTCSPLLWIPTFTLIGVSLYTVSWLPFIFLDRMENRRFLEWSLWKHLEGFLQKEAGWGLIILILLTILLFRLWKDSKKHRQKLLFKILLPALVIVAFAPMLFRLGMTEYYRQTLDPETTAIEELVNDLYDEEFGFGTGKVVLTWPQGTFYSGGKIIRPYDLSLLKDIGREAGLSLSDLDCLYLRAQLDLPPLNWPELDLQDIEYIDKRFYSEEMEFDFWNEKEEQYGDRDLVRLGRPLFTRDRNWAVMTIGRVYGNRGGSGYCFVLQRTDNTWIIRAKRLIWMS